MFYCSHGTVRIRYVSIAEQAGLGNLVDILAEFACGNTGYSLGY